MFILVCPLVYMLVSVLASFVFALAGHVPTRAPENGRFTGHRQGQDAVAAAEAAGMCMVRVECLFNAIYKQVQWQSFAFMTETRSQI